MTLSLSSLAEPLMSVNQGHTYCIQFKHILIITKLTRPKENILAKSVNTVIHAYNLLIKIHVSKIPAGS
jgi:hypothetical protein